MEEVKNTTVEETVETTVNNTEETTTSQQPGMFKVVAQVAGNFLGEMGEMIRKNPGKAAAIGGGAILLERAVIWTWNYCTKKNKKG